MRKTSQPGGYSCAISQLLDSANAQVVIGVFENRQDIDWSCQIGPGYFCSGKKMASFRRSAPSRFATEASSSLTLAKSRSTVDQPGRW